MGRLWACKNGHIRTNISFCGKGTRCECGETFETSPVIEALCRRITTDPDSTEPARADSRDMLLALGSLAAINEFYRRADTIKNDPMATKDQNQAAELYYELAHQMIDHLEQLHMKIEVRGSDMFERLFGRFMQVAKRRQ